MGMGARLGLIENLKLEQRLAGGEGVCRWLSGERPGGGNSHSRGPKAHCGGGGGRRGGQGITERPVWLG